MIPYSRSTVRFITTKVTAPTITMACTREKSRNWTAWVARVPSPGQAGPTSCAKSGYVDCQNHLVGTKSLLARIRLSITPVRVAR